MARRPRECRRHSPGAISDLVSSSQGDALARYFLLAREHVPAQVRVRDMGCRRNTSSELMRRRANGFRMESDGLSLRTSNEDEDEIR